MDNNIKFILNGCDISFIASAPKDITLEQLLKQCDKIKPDWCSCGICSAKEDSEIEIIIDYDSVKKAKDSISCSIEEQTKNLMEEDKVVQYYVVNKDLNMSVGKTTAQVAHAAVLVTEGDHFDIKKFKEYELWEQTGCTKIILSGHQNDLEKLVGMGYYGVRDFGLTEIEPNSLTCVGVGVVHKSEAPKEIKRLQLL